MGRRRSPGVAVAIVASCAVAGCQLIAGVEDIELTGTGDASPGDATSAGEASPDAPVGADSSGDESAVDAAGVDGSLEASADGAPETSADGPHDAPPEGPPDTSAEGPPALTYAQEVLLDSPLAYWRFGEASGTTAVDSSGYNVTGTYIGGCTPGAAGAIANDPNTAVTFDGTSGYMSAGNVFPFTGTVSFSLEAWVKPVINANDQDIMSRNDGQGSGALGYFMFVEPQATSLMDFSRYDSASGHAIAQSSVTITSTAYTHLVGVYDSGQQMVFLYVNGVLSGSHAATLGNPTTTNGFVVAALSGGSFSWFMGQIDEVAVYGTALSLARVQAHHNVGLGLPP